MQSNRRRMVQMLAAFVGTAAYAAPGHARRIRFRGRGLARGVAIPKGGRVLSQAELKECVQQQTQIDQLEARLSGLDTNVQTEERRIASLEHELRALEADASRSEPNRLRYNGLVDEYNSSLPRYNAAIEEYNGAVARQRSVVERFNAECADTYYYELDMDIVARELGL